MIKIVDLVGLTNAITDVIVKVTDKELKSLGLRKGFLNTKVNISYDDFLDTSGLMTEFYFAIIEKGE